MNTEEFIEKANSVHNCRYDYSKVDYKNKSTKVCIICSEHGEFWQDPKHHLRGQGCPKCSKKESSNKKTLTTEEFIKKAKEIHGDKYDYSKVEYTSTNDKVCIICPEHGEFWQTPQNHLQNKGCKLCGVEEVKKTKAYTNENFIELSNKIHGGKYRYDKVKYVNSNTEVIITCPLHGDFTQKPYIHLQGFGCAKCSKRYQYTTSDFIDELRKVHGNRYDYSKTIYTNSHSKIKIICPEHGVFEQRAYEHLQGRGCPKCSHTCSKPEQDLGDFIQEICGKISVKDKQVLNGRELDIYIPEKKIAIEYDGLIWHSEKFGKDKNYHLGKTLECEKQGVRLIHIFENEWLEHKEIVKTKLKHILGYDTGLPKVYARKCIVKEIDTRMAKEFFEQNYIQGFSKSSVYLGCFYNSELVSAMSFKICKNGSDKWELTRFATDITKHCVGVGGKLFKYFVRNYNPSEVKSFADRRWSTTLQENLYDKIGFKFDGVLRPDYRYVINGKRIHKFDCRKARLLKKYGGNFLNNDMTEHEMCQKLKFYHIYDCGLIKYKWVSNVLDYGKIL